MLKKLNEEQLNKNNDILIEIKKFLDIFRQLKLFPSEYPLLVKEVNGIIEDIIFPGEIDFLFEEYNFTKEQEHKFKECLILYLNLKKDELTDI